MSMFMPSKVFSKQLVTRCIWHIKLVLELAAPKLCSHAE